MNAHAWRLHPAWQEPRASRHEVWTHYDAIVRGECPADAVLQDAARRARARDDAAGVCDLTTLRALRHLILEELAEATDLARTATRMARTEALRASECFASVVLARARRSNGEPHRALQILQALHRYADPAFHGWIQWELVLTGHPAEPTSPLAQALHAALAHARAGERAPCEHALSTLERSMAATALLRQDLAVVGLGLGLDTNDERLPHDVRRWQHGERGDLPWGLAGLSGSEQPVHVLVVPGQRGRRILDTALPLHGPLERLPSTPGAQNRSDALIAALGLAGPAGSADAELFAAVYGFPFVRATHQGVLDVLVHRTRARLPSLGRLERIEDGYALAPALPFSVHDPRSGSRDDDRVLRLVAARGSLTAREASASLGVSLRKAQQVLDSLAGSGACVQLRAGRHYEYRVEDTTFQEPTDVRRS